MGMTRVFQQGNEDDPQSRRLRVLLVEHHPLIREGLRRLLEMESQGAIVTEVESGEEALGVTRQWQPDIAIIDLALPPRGGIATIHTLKRQCPTTVVMALSLEDDERYRRAVFEAGAAVLVRNDGHGQAILIALRGFMPRWSV
jgi:DNA-binding NarL/FixJ family response regulator